MDAELWIFCSSQALGTMIGHMVARVGIVEWWRLVF